MRRRHHKTNYFSYDVVILLPVLFLTGIGVAMVYSASSAIALHDYGNEYYFFAKQLVFAGLGLLGMLVCR